MTTILLIAALLCAVLDWVAVARQVKPLEYFAKPGVMVLLLGWLWLSSGFQDGLAWFALGLLFSMGGDIALMLPREQFIAGLVSFLLAHVAYLVGFTQGPLPLNYVSLALAVLVGLTASQVYRRVAGGLKASGQEKLKLPVLAYTAVISLMLLSALLTLVRPEWAAQPALLVSSGALLFFISDGTLAWNKFVSPLPHGRLVVIITYHLGQMLIILGAAGQMVK